MLRMLQCFEFQFTPLREGRRFWIALFARILLIFQFTPLREGRQVSFAQPNKREISIHAPPRGATIPRLDGERSAGNFNSRPSARGDQTAVDGFLRDAISIHAPP